MGEVTTKRFACSLLIISVLLIFPHAAYPAEPNLGQKAGQSGQITRGRAQFDNSGKNINTNFGQIRDFNYNPDNSPTSRNLFRNSNNHHMCKHKFNPLYAPLYYLGYYGYAPYTNYSTYRDPDYPLGYGTTMGTTLERPSNIEVNQFFRDSPSRGYYPKEYSGAVYAYTDVLPGYAPDNYSPSPAVEQTIYVWVDDSGVKNYANGLDLVPLRYRDIVTTLNME